MSNDSEEKNIIREVLKSSDSDGNMGIHRLVLQYLDPYIQNGLDAILDDGYLLYLKDVEEEIGEFLQAHITDDDALTIAIADAYGSEQLKATIMQKLQTILFNQYQGVAPVPKRKISEYIQYADSDETRKEFDECYREYVQGIQELQDVAEDLLEKLKFSKQTDEIKSKSASLIIFVSLLESLKDKDFFKTMTYDTMIPTTKLFYQEIFLSEDSERVLNQVLMQAVDSLSSVDEEKTHYSLDDIYAAVPNAIISYELLENEEINPNFVTLDVPFFQSFYQLASKFSSDKEDSEAFQKKVYYFLIQKVDDFQREFMTFYDDDLEDNDELLYTKERPIIRH